MQQKLTAEELQELETIKETYSKILVNLGQVGVERFGLEEKQTQLNSLFKELNEFEINVKKELAELNAREKKFGADINTKYGNCEINPETGEVVQKM